MTELTEHAKTILRAIADGKVIETNFQLDKWEMLSLRSALGHLLNHPESVRIKPETRSINGTEFGAPVSKNLKGDWAFSDAQMRMFRNFGWDEEKDRDTAYQAVVDALEGETK